MADISIPKPTTGLLTTDALAGPRSRARKEGAVKWILFSAALVSIAISVLIVLSLINEARVFILEVDWANTWGQQGWFPRQGLYDMPTLLVSSLIVTVVAMFVAGPLGLGAAVYLSEYASRRTRSLLKPILEILAGVPSVVLGFFALFFISPQVIERIGRNGWLVVGAIMIIVYVGMVFRWARQAMVAEPGTTLRTQLIRILTLTTLVALGLILIWWINDVAGSSDPASADFFTVKRSGQLAAAAVGVGILTIPLVASVSEDALAAVPEELRAASAGLGARKMTTTVQVVLPAAVSGIVAAFIIGISRALGETMVVFMAGGAADAARFTASPFDGGLTMTAGMASLATGTDNVVGEGLTFQSLYFVGLVLFIITLALNVMAGRYVSRVREKY
ncbi:MAG: ABC transporter permease subunit [Acidimicrobiales bacterium]|nr:ABC transporter permease subunit [Acidimicrobiales bacterium]RZV47662.1 MAG: ABC transporter permease subunit [Acidimicrobiales bacterium]